MTTKKIIICSNAYPPNFIGGAELIAHYQAKTLKKLGHEVIVFAGEFNNRGRRYKIKKDIYEDIPIYRVCLHDKDYSSDFINFYNSTIENIFRDVIQQEKPHIAHFHNLIGLSVGLPRISKKKNIKTILTLHDFWGVCFKNTLMKNNGEICEEAFECIECNHVMTGDNMVRVPFQMRKDFVLYQFKYVDTFIAPSNYYAQLYLKAGFSEDKMVVIPNGIDIDRFSTIEKKVDNDHIRFSFVGHLGKHKGVHVLLDALAIIDNKKSIKMNLIGDGEDRELYEKQVKQKGLKDVVKFWGKINNSQIEDVYRETDILVVPSIWPENRVVSITEAMASRIPVIASKIGAIPELVDDDQTGYLFEFGNSHDLALKMSKFISNPGVLQEFGKNSYNKIKSFSFENQVGEILDVYEKNQNKHQIEKSEKELILCVGKIIDPDCAKTMDIFLKETGRAYRFIMINWVGEKEISEAQLLWVVDGQTELSELKIAAKYNLPFIVPENNSELTDFCRSNNCGLYYSTVVEAVECLKYLSENQMVGSAMGQNSYDFYAHNANTL